MPKTNPIESLLYDYDYDGRDNMYEYWMENRQDFLQYIDTPKFKSKYTAQHLEAFEYKVRWASHYGLFYRLYIEIFIVKGYEFKGFDQIPMMFSGQNMTLNSFIDKLSKHVTKCEKTDLRGLNLIDYLFKDLVIENVDFSYADLDYTTFENCTFINCLFNKTCFYRSKIINCHFYKSCKFFNNNFKRTFISGDFDCLIDFPVIKLPHIFERIKRLFGFESYPLNYTKILSQSFIDNCGDRDFRRQLNRIFK